MSSNEMKIGEYCGRGSGWFDRLTNLYTVSSLAKQKEARGIPPLPYTQKRPQHFTATVFNAFRSFDFALDSIASLQNDRVPLRMTR